MKPRLPAALGLAALVACATASPGAPVALSPVPPGPVALEFHASGEVLWAYVRQESTRRASYDGWRVTGPSVSLVRGPDGLWHGTFQGRDALLAAVPGKITGTGIDISVLRQADGSIAVSGSWLGAPVGFQLAGDRVRGSAGANSFDLWRAGPGMYSNDAAGLLTLAGDAARLEEPVMPQLPLAMLAVLLQ